MHAGHHRHQLLHAEFAKWLADSIMQGTRYDGAPPTLTCATKGRRQ